MAIFFLFIGIQHLRCCETKSNRTTDVTVAIGIRRLRRPQIHYRITYQAVTTGALNELRYRSYSQPGGLKIQ